MNQLSNLLAGLKDSGVLSAAATATAHELIGEKEGFAFESPRGGKPIDVNAIPYAVRRNVEEPKKDPGRKEAEEEKPANDEATRQKLIMQAWTPHDLRRTSATNMSALGYSDEVIDAVLNHVKKGAPLFSGLPRHPAACRGLTEAALGSPPHPPPGYWWRW